MFFYARQQCNFALIRVFKQLSTQKQDNIAVQTVFFCHFSTKSNKYHNKKRNKLEQNLTQ